MLRPCTNPPWTPLLLASLVKSEACSRVDWATSRLPRRSSIGALDLAKLNCLMLRPCTNPPWTPLLLASLVKSEACSRVDWATSRLPRRSSIGALVHYASCCINLPVRQGSSC
ncbi:hypothetical protein RJT34_16586 [Clitoria ternatea]|uniref:Uncharacterized protein n=1 Tax=Clitoria ternatea TaxID=43366 RepID=A0AAN9J9G5_CLITE